MNQAYVYELLVDGVVRYVGMGKGNRVTVHLSIANRINRKIAGGENVTAQRVHLLLAEAIRDGATITNQFVFQGLTNEAARALEVQRIASWPSGQLWNSHPGGGGASAERMTELWADPEWRARQIVALQASWDDPDYRAYSEAAKQQWSDPESREKLMAAAKEKWTPELRAWRSQKTQEQFNSPEARDRAREAIRARWADPVQRAKMSAAIRAGKQRKRLSAQQLPQDPVS